MNRPDTFPFVAESIAPDSALTYSYRIRLVGSNSSFKIHVLSLAHVPPLPFPLRLIQGKSVSFPRLRSTVTSILRVVAGAHELDCSEDGLGYHATTWMPFLPSADSVLFENVGKAYKGGSTRYDEIGQQAAMPVYL